MKRTDRIMKSNFKVYILYLGITGLILFSSLANIEKRNNERATLAYDTTAYLTGHYGIETKSNFQEQTQKSTYRTMLVNTMDKQSSIELTNEEYDLLLRLVESEAGGEDMEGKMLVANVVINRVQSDQFPDTVEEVILQGNGTKTQFSPVGSGKIYRVTVSDETKEAVARVLEGEDESQGALYFVSARYAAKDKLKWFYEKLDWLFTHGGHDFFKPL